MTTEQDRQGHRKHHPMSAGKPQPGPRFDWHLHTVNGGSRSPSRRFNHGITKSSTLFQGEWLQCWCDPLWNVLEWCLGRFPKLGGPQGELREPPETFSSHGSRCWELGLEAKVAKCSDTCKRCHLALVIPSDTNRETICTAAGTEGAGKA